MTDRPERRGPKPRARQKASAETKTGSEMHIKASSKLRAYFLAGILITAPVSITMYLAWVIVSFIDNRVTAFIPAQYNPETYLPFALPGLGVVIVLVGLTLIGAFTAGFFGRLIMRTYEGLLNRMPVIRSVYGAIKQIVETVLAQQSAAFREAVLIEYPRRGLWAIAFITGQTEGEVQNLTDEDMVNIFLPTTPNPTSGFLLFVARRDIVSLSMSVEEAIKMVISGGIVTPPDNRPPEVRDEPQIVVSLHEAGDIAREREGASGQLPPPRQTGHRRAEETAED